REWFDTQHVDALMDVAASATALAAIELAKTKNKIVVLNGPGTTRITNEACTPISIHYTYGDLEQYFLWAISALAKRAVAALVPRWVLDRGPLCRLTADRRSFSTRPHGPHP